MNKDEFVARVIEIAREHGYTIEDSRNGKQIDFGQKKLHENHLKKLFELGILKDVAVLIEKVAPGRPCTHKPMREIIDKIRLGDIR